MPTPWACARVAVVGKQTMHRTPCVLDLWQEWEERRRRSRDRGASSSGERMLADYRKSMTKAGWMVLPSCCSGGGGGAALPAAELGWQVWDWEGRGELHRGGEAGGLRQPRKLLISWSSKRAKSPKEPYKKAQKNPLKNKLLANNVILYPFHNFKLNILS
jgi:hypothetical protein